MTHFGGPFRDFLFTVLELQQPLGRPHGRFRMFSWAVVMKLATGITAILQTGAAPTHNRS
jgi:hypothetical protein